MPKKETRSPSTPVPARQAGPPTWALAAVAGIVATFTLATSIISWIDLPAPFDDAGSLVMRLFGAMCVAIILVIVVSKLWEARRAAAWPQAAGRIVKSTIEARRDQSAGEATTVTNVPVVEYEFAVAGTTYRGTRISIGEDSGGANTDTTLARYPVAATVMVYYDPADPTDCVLERDIPREFGRGCALIVAIGAIVVAGVYWLATSGTNLVAAHLPEDANAPLVVLTSAMGVVVLAFFFAGRRISRDAAGWPVTRGTVVISSTEAVHQTDQGRDLIFHAPVVEFTYQVHGREYRSRQITLGAKLAGTRSFAEQIAARYPQGSAVEVHYDSANPSNAVLQVTSSASWLLLVLALFCFGVAVHASGILRH
ncbi:MAG: DUF3592 domain-containing protein [Bradyrhizobium sp.]